MRDYLCLALLAFSSLIIGCETKVTTQDNCGDGFLDPGEECDGEEIPVTSCVSLGFYEQNGSLACHADCSLDVSACSSRCGDGIIQAIHGEQCDGENLAETSCMDLQLGGGTLGCKNSCRWDTSGCEVHAICGDGTVAFPFEQCEPDDMHGETCLSLGYYGGELACGEDCQAFDDGGCSGRCGDDIVQEGTAEVCDGGDLAGETCQTQGFYEGSLSCGSECLPDTSACSYNCGDGAIQVNHGEECDGANLGGNTCVILGYSEGSGALGCTSGCLFDESACEPKSGNANLGALTVNHGTLTPGFSPSVTSYAMSVYFSILSMTVTATKADPYASVVIIPTQPMDLVEGSNLVTVKVTAENGVQKEYFITIQRQSAQDLVSPNIGMMKFVPGGTFQRDSNAANLSTVTAFRMSEKEITREQFVAVTGISDPSESLVSTGVTDPVQNVNWYHALVFCNRLSMLEGKTPVYSIGGSTDPAAWGAVPLINSALWNAVTANWSANGYRLPTEMEWMWAAMGAQDPSTGFAKAFAGSTGTNVIGDYAWIFENSTFTSHPVGSKLPNELGLSDMSGNIWERCWDWSATYPAGSLTDYRGPVTGSTRITHGGGWSNIASYSAIGYRGGDNPQDRMNYVGFRVACQ
ncbi:SUMF1/EgtB/PvdO family nonheme iron enzyme [Myxococcota bacterium]|nr:SUMF1/EgtB/PvdO family nonheme iron enzyme [Myxococcota bacterium]MBU1410732.1 SUMF1/EgtB/PvdO family nonheme iron enzyme [Myxococcota bacterium]MBU1509394.1 SUMF1/EgtB/PvdO family nonheme iron enzyme [Myxococcota bacterium]